tara:strand:+ start:505 stop:1341 length:837 start_codon:yes stop_codon:yes gene_type:complete
MIIWIASYPKSGNTLLRSILASYLFSKDGDINFDYLYKIKQFPSFDQFKNLGIDLKNEKEIFDNFIEAQKLINQQSNQLNFIKTHSSLARINNCNFTDFKNTLGAIYIVRDPRNVVTSFAHHYNLQIDEATNVMMDPTRWLVKTSLMCKTFLGSWNVNYNSWKQLKDNVLFIKYEDLVNKKKTTVLKIFKFLQNLGLSNFKPDMRKLNKIIKSSEFDKMQKLEKKVDFKEAIIDPITKQKKQFFNLGPKNDYKSNLSKEIRYKIEKEFKKEMVELGYL